MSKTAKNEKEKNIKAKERIHLGKLDRDNPYIVEIETPENIIELKINVKKRRK